MTDFLVLYVDCIQLCESHVLKHCSLILMHALFRSWHWNRSEIHIFLILAYLKSELAESAQPRIPVTRPSFGQVQVRVWDRD